MYFINYVKDCIWYAKRYPLNGGKFRIWIRNVLYVNAQPKYLLGRVISSIIWFDRKLFPAT